MRLACIKQCAVLRELRCIASRAATGEAAVRSAEERVVDQDAMIPNETGELPLAFSFEVARKPNGWWHVTAKNHHVGCYLIGMDLGALLHEAPYVLNHLLKLDGPKPA